MAQSDLEALSKLDLLYKRLSAVAYVVGSVLELPCAVVDVNSNVVFESPRGHIGNCFCKRLSAVTGKQYNLDHFFERCHRIGVGSGHSIYSCPFGLINVLVPIFDKTEYVAALQIGPFMLQDSEELLFKHGLTDIDMISPDESLTDLMQFLRRLPKGSTDYLVSITRITKALLTDETISLKFAVGTPTVVKDSMDGDFDLIYAIQQFVSSHYADPDISLEMVAKHVYVHPSYVSHIFSDQFGVGFREYINSLRVKHAKALLRTTNRPIGEICRLIGYSDHSYFNKVFRTREGMTPSAYRSQAAQSKNAHGLQAATGD